MPACPPALSFFRSYCDSEFCLGMIPAPGLLIRPLSRNKIFRGRTKAVDGAEDVGRLRPWHVMPRHGSLSACYHPSHRIPHQQTPTRDVAGQDAPSGLLLLDGHCECISSYVLQLLRRLRSEHNYHELVSHLSANVTATTTPILPTFAPDIATNITIRPVGIQEPSAITHKRLRRV
jgi:hypothetical protein